MWDEFATAWNDGVQPGKIVFLFVMGGERFWVRMLETSIDFLPSELEKSYYVGDAAGRPALGTSVKDWNDTDRKWALNVGLPFLYVSHRLVAIYINKCVCNRSVQLYLCCTRSGWIVKYTRGVLLRPANSP